MTREVTDNLYIDLEYFTPEEYYVYEAEAEALLTSQATFVCVADGGAVKDFEVALSVSVTQTTQETRVRDFTAPLGTAFDTIMVIDALRITEVTLIVTAGVSAVPEINRATSVTLSNIVTLNAQAIKSVETSAQLTGTATQTTTATKAKFAQAALSSTTTLSSQGDTLVRYQGPIFWRGVGKPAILETEKKFGTTSLYLNGSSYLYANDDAVLNIPTTDASTAGEFSIEFFIYPTQLPSGNNKAFIIGQWVGNTESNHNWQIYLNSSGNPIWQRKNEVNAIVGQITSTRAITVNTWNHIAIARQRNSSSSATTRIWVNGLSGGTNIDRAAFRNNVTSQLRLGYSGNTNDDSTYYQGYIDSLSFMIGNKAFLASSTTITVPTTEPFLQSETVVLNNFNDSYFNSSTLGFQLFSSAITAQFSSNAVAEKVIVASAQLNTAFTQTAPGGFLQDFIANLPTVASQLTAAGRVGEFLVSANAEFAQNTTAVATLDSTIVDIPFDFYLDAEADRTRSTPAALTAEFTHSVNAVKTTDNVTAQSAEFTQAASIARTRDNEVQSQAEFTQTTLAAAVIDSDVVDIPIDFFQTADAVVTRDASAQFDAVISKITVVGKTGEGIVDLDSQFAFTVTAEVTSGSVVVAQSQFTQSTEAVRIKPLAAQLSVVSTLAADAETVSVFTSTQTSEFTQSTDIARTRGFVSNQDTAFTQTAAVAKTTDNIVTMSTAFAQTADIDLVADSIILGPTSFNQNTQAVKTAQGESTQTSEFALTAQGEVGNIGEAQLNSTFTLTATAAKTAQFIIFEPVVVTVTASGTVTRQGNVDVNSESALTATPGKILQGSAELTAFYSQLTVGSEQSTGSALLSSQFVMTTVGKIINIDPDLTYMIRRERRDYVIPEEIREDIVIPELRTTIIRRA